MKRVQWYMLSGGHCFNAVSLPINSWDWAGEGIDDMSP